MRKFAGKKLCWRLFLIKLQAWRPETLSKRDFWYFPLNFATFPILRKTYFVENLRTADLTLLEELFCRKNMVMNFWKMVTRIRYYKKREAIEKEKIFHLLIEFLLYLRITTWYICGKFLVNFMREKIIFERNNEKFYNLVYLRLLFGLSSRFFTTRMIPYTSRHTTSFQRTSIRRRQRRIDAETTSCVYWDRRCSSYQFLNQSLQTVMSWKNYILLQWSNTACKVFKKTEFYRVRMFVHSDWMWGYASWSHHIPVLNPYNAYNKRIRLIIFINFVLDYPRRLWE